MERLNVAVIGAGTMGYVHAMAYLRIDEARLVAICDLDPNKARSLADRTGAEKAYTDYKEALKESLDIVNICVPTMLHPRIAIDAAKSGTNVLCEKPVALSLEEADQMIEAAGKAGVKFMVAHVLRFMSEYRKVKEIADSREMGEVVSAFGGRYGAAPRGWENWYSNPAYSGGVIFDLQIHDLDFLNWLFGRPRKVFCDGLRLRSEKGSWDHVFTEISYPTGKGLAVASWLMPKTFPFTAELRVICEEGTLELNTKAEKPLTIFRENKGAEYPELPRKNGYLTEIGYFVHCILEDVEPEVMTPQDARLALETAITARKSAEEGTPLEL